MFVMVLSPQSASVEHAGAEQEFTEVDPAGDVVPAGQAVHAELSAAAPYVPATHKHTDDPACDARLGAHATQIPFASAK